MRINIDRLKTTLLDLSRIGFNEADKGIYRTSFSEADMAARRWLMQTLEAEGFLTEMDGAGEAVFTLVGRCAPLAGLLKQPSGLHDV